MDYNLLIGIDMPQILRSIRHILPLFLLVLLGGCVAAGGGSATNLSDTAPTLGTELRDRLYDRFYMEGSLLQMHGEYAGAIREYRRALRFDSTRSSLHYALARSYQALGITDSALLHGRSAVAASPSNVDALQLLAEVSLATGNIEESISSYDAIVRLDPENIQARMMIARSWIHRDPLRAINEYEEIRRIVGDEIEILYTLTELYLDNSFSVKAIETMRALLYIGNDPAGTYRVISHTMLQSGRYHDAQLLLDEATANIPGDSARRGYHLTQISDLNQMLDLSTDRPAGLVEFGTRLALQSRRFAADSWRVDYESAMLLYRLKASVADSVLVRALASAGIPPSVWNDAAEKLLEDHRHDLLLQRIAPTAGRFHDDPEISYTLGRAWLESDRPDSAERHLRRAVATDPANADAWYLLGDTYLANGKIVAGNAALKRALDEDPGNPDALERLARSLAERNENLEEALRLGRSALEAEPENERYLETIGLIYYRLEDPRQALPYLEKASQAGGAGPETLELLGDIQAALGNGSAAHESYRRAAQLAPENTRLSRKAGGE